MLPSFHDNHLTAYEVDCEQRSVRLKIRFAGDGGADKVCVVAFGGVQAYHFRSDAFGNILFGITVLQAADFFARFGAQIGEAHKADGAASLDDIRRAIETGEAKAFEIESVIGLCGWIVAREASRAE
jgi:hypothetical protein